MCDLKYAKYQGRKEFSSLLENQNDSKLILLTIPLPIPKIEIPTVPG